MPATLEREIDDLYQLPLAEFTAARNALVKKVRGADATHVRTLRKPTVVAWAVNQVYWQSRPVFDRLMKAGERLRHAQIAALSGKSADLREANEAHRKAIADAVQAAEKIAAGSGSHPPPDALMRTLEALSLAKEPPAPPGRLSDALQPAGFEALTGVQVRLAASAEAPAAKKPDRKRAAEERKRAAEEKKRAAEIKRAEAALERARAKMRLAEEALKRTRDHS